MRCYEWLAKNLPTVFERAGIAKTLAEGSAYSDGDKTGQYMLQWEMAGIPFEHGTALYMVMNWKYTNEVRETSTGWVSPSQWVIDNYPRFKHLFEGMK